MLAKPQIGFVANWRHLGQMNTVLVQRQKSLQTLCVSRVALRYGQRLHALAQRVAGPLGVIALAGVWRSKTIVYDQRQGCPTDDVIDSGPVARKLFGRERLYSSLSMQLDYIVYLITQIVAAKEHWKVRAIRIHHVPDVLGNDKRRVSGTDEKIRVRTEVLVQVFHGVFGLQPLRKGAFDCHRVCKAFIWGSKLIKKVTFNIVSILAVAVIYLPSPELMYTTLLHRCAQLFWTAFARLSTPSLSL